jgi:Zn ribbon nucleic-acid-binding protein
MLLNQDASSEETFREHRKNLKLMDSKKRHTHVAIGKADDQLASLMEYETEDSEKSEDESEPDTPEVDSTILAQQLQDIYKARLELERDLHNQEAALTTTSSEVESLRKRIDSAEALIVNNILTDEERNSSLALNRLLESATCPACGTRQLALQEVARRNAQLAQCVLCGSESPQKELELLSTLRSQMADKLYAQRAAEGLVRTARAKLDETQRREWDLRTQYNIITLRSLLSRSSPFSNRIYHLDHVPTCCHLRLDFSVKNRIWKLRYSSCKTDSRMSTSASA